VSGRFAVLEEGNIVLYDKIFLSVLWPVHLSSIALKRLCGIIGKELKFLARLALMIYLVVPLILLCPSYYTFSMHVLVISCRFSSDPLVFARD
jgi:hypothetical protein